MLRIPSSALAALAAMSAFLHVARGDDQANHHKHVGFSTRSARSVQSGPWSDPAPWLRPHSPAMLLENVTVDQAGNVEKRIHQVALGAPAFGANASLRRGWATFFGHTAMLVGNEDLGMRIAAIAEKESSMWNGRKETDPQVAKLLRKYWLAVGQRYQEEDFKKEGQPWSAAFVSWVVKEAGAGDLFKYNSAHCFYLAAAKENREKMNDNPFKAYRTNEVKLEVGDIVCQTRGDVMATYEKLNAKDFYATHCDIVVKVSAGEAVTIGGNVSNTVKQSRVPLDAKGHIENGSAKYIAVVKVGPTKQP